ncbi:MAG: 4-(cytidine 5'-diphospho)-2-C-methyl-D-erythritol kinase [Pirellulales bacterium]
MHIRRRDDLFELWAPAKLNLHLEVLGRRSDGFHELETLMCPINLCDTLYVQSHSSGRIRLDCQFADRRLPNGSPEARLADEGADNLVCRALELVRHEAGVKLGATVRLVKRIPVAAGLAGGSSDAAAALVAAAAAWKIDFTPQDLLRLAAQLGSDIAFFLQTGWAVCRGRGEIVQPVAGLGNLAVVVVTPPQGLATADVFAALRRHDEQRGRTDHEHRSIDGLLDAVQTGHLGRIGQALHNRLQTVAGRLSPWIARLADEFARAGVVGHLMSGSGTSYFGICRGARHARGIARRMVARGLGRAFVVRSRQ